MYRKPIPIDRARGVGFRYCTGHLQTGKVLGQHVQTVKERRGALSSLLGDINHRSQGIFAA